MTETPIPLICILGPTATGKTRLAAQLAAIANGEVISADSRQVYRQMDVGTGKDLEDYVVGGRTVRSHLIDIVDPGYEYNVYEFKRDCVTAIREIHSRGRLPVLCGGTGLYLSAVLQDYQLLSAPPDPARRAELQATSTEQLLAELRSHGPLHNTSDVRDRKRPDSRNRDRGGRSLRLRAVDRTRLARLRASLGTPRITKAHHSAVGGPARTRAARRSPRIAGSRADPRPADLLRTGIPVRHRAPTRRHHTQADVRRAQRRDPPIRQAARYVVSANGTSGRRNPLARRPGLPRGQCEEGNGPTLNYMDFSSTVIGCCSQRFDSALSDQ